MDSSKQQTTIAVPPTTTAIYITALTLIPQPSCVSISWKQGSATMGTTFLGHSPDYIMVDKVFGSPFTVFENGEMPEELSVTFEYGSEDKEGVADGSTDESKALDKWEGWSVEQPVLERCGPAGSSKKVLVKGYDKNDIGRSRPMTVTIMFSCPMRGLRKA